MQSPKSELLATVQADGLSAVGWGRRGRPNCSKYRSCRNRSGVAAIEFLIYMPIFVAFVATMFWLVRVQNTALEVGILAETKAAEKAVLLAHHSQLKHSESFAATAAMAELQELVQGFSHGLGVTKGLVTGESTLDTGEGVWGTVTAVGTTQDQHTLLTHSWESDVFSFPQTKSDQAELTLPASVKGIAPKISDLAAFRALLSFDGGAAGHLGSSAINHLRKSVKQQRDNLPGKLVNLRSEIASLETELSNLLKAPVPDWTEIRRVREIIADKRQSEQKLIEAIRDADKALKHIDAVSSDDRPSDTEID